VAQGERPEFNPQYHKKKKKKRKEKKREQAFLVTDFLLAFMYHNI
jgi:hypothetical protein